MGFESQSERSSVIKEIEGAENRQRRAESLRQVEIYNDRGFQYVYEKLRQKFSDGTVSEMPIVASINLARRIVKQESGLYRTRPERDWTNLSDDQKVVVNKIYDAMRFDSKMLKSNESFKLQSQNHIMILPKKGQLIMRVLRNHHLDSIPDREDPETADGYILSVFDKFQFLTDETKNNKPTGYVGSSQTFNSTKSNRTNERIGDGDDYKEEKKLFLVWTPEFNYWMTETGIIVDENGKPVKDMDEIISPLSDLKLIPIIDISSEKDFEYWVRQGQNLTEFTIDYNVALSSLGQVVQMQGFAQAYMKGPAEMIPENLQIGPNFILKLPIDPDNPVDTEFGYASPSPDLAGSSQYVEMLLANFLSSRGVDPKTISGQADATRFSSGVERLLAEMDKFASSKDDMATYERAEQQAWNLIKGWHNSLRDTDLLDDEFKTTELPDDSQVIIKYAEPTSIKSDDELIDIATKRIEAGLSSKKRELMKLEGLGEEDAEKLLLEIEKEEFGSGSVIEREVLDADQQV